MKHHKFINCGQYRAKQTRIMFLFEGVETIPDECKEVGKYELLETVRKYIMILEDIVQSGK